jgi:hypothetical protein
MLSEPPDDLADRIVWRREAEETFADKVRRRLTQIVVGAYETYLGTLTAAGDLSAFDAIPQQWSVYVLDELSDDLDEMYKAGALTAWNTAPTTTTLPTSAATGWAQIIAADAIDYQAQATNRLVGVGDDIWRKVNSQVTDALQKGASTEDLKKGIEQVTQFSEFRADTIARTEMNAAFVNGAYEGEVALGEYGPVYKEWLPVGDARTRPEHLAMEGVVVPFAEDFIVGDEPMAHPLADGASAGNSVNCRCDVLFFYPGDTLPDGTLVEAPATMSQNVEVDEVAAAEEMPLADPGAVLRGDFYQPARLSASDFDGQWDDIYEKGGGPYGDLDPRGDQHLAEMWRRQGFDALPRVVSADEYDALLGDGWRQMHRGLAADTDEIVAGYVEQFIAGADPFVGKGLFGSGTYAAEALDTAENFTRQTARGEATQTGQVLNMALRPDARVVDMEDVWAGMRQVEQEERDFANALRAKYNLEDAGWSDLQAAANDAERAMMRELSQRENLLAERPSNWATVNGYDAIRIERPRVRFTGNDDDFVDDTYWIILNRGALAVKEPT